MGLSHTVVQIVTDDMPFLVDSVTAELSTEGRGVHLVVHPQFVVRRDLDGRLLELVGLGLEELREVAARRGRRVVDAHRDRP